MVTTERRTPMKTDTFGTFIISHGRPDKVVTAKTLKRSGYTGPLYIVCDNEDKTVDQYRENFGFDKVLVFDKLRYAAMVDNCDNFQNRRTTTHARNACFDFAAQLDFDYFLVLDDDYTDFRFTFGLDGKFSRRKIENIDLIFSVLRRFLDTDDRIDSVCVMQGGDMTGGEKGHQWKQYIFPWKNRKAMNSFFCKTSRRFWFFSRLNEDVNTYLSRGNRGRLFMTLPEVYLNQAQTQATSGGMSEAYLASGTYVKSFYSVMINPSFIYVTIKPAMNRIHHRMRWKNAVPKILNENHKKL